MLALSVGLCWPLGCVERRPVGRIDKLVADLGEAPLGSVHLGAAKPQRNDITEELIGYRETAVPALVKALGSDNPVQVGYAAYCLQRMRIDTGVPAAKRALDKFMQKTKPYATIEVRFAILGLRDYISEFEAIPMTPF